MKRIEYLLEWLIFSSRWPISNGSETTGTLVGTGFSPTRP
jgi:hypothetical protein